MEKQTNTEQADATNSSNGFKGFKKARSVTLELFKFGAGPMYVRFLSELYKGKVVDDKKEPPTMAHVMRIDGTTGVETEGEIILGSVLRERLNEAYPDGGYVGKVFEISKQAPEGARKYSLWSVAEVEYAE